MFGGGGGDGGGDGDGGGLAAWTPALPLKCGEAGNSLAHKAEYSWFTNLEAFMLKLIIIC